MISLEVGSSLNCCRTLIVLHVMNSLINMNLGSDLPKSCALLDEIPLPCAKQMWTAKTAAAWTEGYLRYLSIREGNKMPTVGDLRRAGAVEANSGTIKDLSNWSSDVDDLGSLLLMVV